VTQPIPDSKLLASHRRSDRGACGFVLVDHPGITPIFEFSRMGGSGGYLLVIAVNGAGRPENKLNRTAAIRAAVLDLPGLFRATRFPNQRRSGLWLWALLSHCFVEQTSDRVEIFSGSGPP
jgi:hypothetical protein